jgi:3-hydroxymyristoyl/3-hydroxydecanoyl-(acyl carrier protein) dehydratase
MGLSGCAGRSIVNGSHAYDLYVDTEMTLLGKLNELGDEKRWETTEGVLWLADGKRQYKPELLYSSEDVDGLDSDIILNRRKMKDRRNIVWDLEQILEITGGSPSKIWGERYADLDSLTKRARMPLPPFLFVSRITGIDAEFGQFRPSSIEIEYDITEDCVMLLSRNTISYVLLTESSHIAIFLLAYIGIDLVYGQNISYRILNTQESLHSDFPVIGDTVHSRLEFLDFTQSGSTTLVKSRFTTYNKDELVMTMELLGGFFTEDDLQETKGILDVNTAMIKPWRPVPPGRKQRKEQITDIQAFYDGKYGPVLYPTRRSKKAETGYINSMIRMIDRVISMDFTGGLYGLGKIVAEKDIDEDHWAFKVHFKNDPVFPGSLIAEAGNQIQLLFAMNAGYIADGKYHVSCKRDLMIKSVFRGQITPAASTIRFEQNIKEITETDGVVVIVSDSDAYWQGKHVVRTENLSIEIEG